jgi:hypothetical protein
MARTTGSALESKFMLGNNKDVQEAPSPRGIFEGPSVGSLQQRQRWDSLSQAHGKTLPPPR